MDHEIVLDITIVMKRIDSLQKAELALLILPELSTDILAKFPELRPNQN